MRYEKKKKKANQLAFSISLVETCKKLSRTIDGTDSVVRPWQCYTKGQKLWSASANNCALSLLLPEYHNHVTSLLFINLKGA